MPEEDNNIAVGLVPEPVKYTTTQEELKMPTQGLIIVDPKPEDYVFGGSPLTKVILRPDGQHDAYLPVVEIQRLRDGVGEDSFWCVACSGNSCKEITHKEMYGYEINMDDQYTAIGSGTIRGQGNSVAKVAEWVRKNSFIKEKNRIRFAKSLDEIYVPVTGEELAKGKKNLELYEFGYEWLPRPFNTASCTPAVLMDALKCAPIQVSVDGSGYQFNNQGYIGSFVNYTHEVLIFGYVEGQFWKIFDSETEQALKFAWSYPFGFPMIHSIKKKYANVPQEWPSRDRFCERIQRWFDSLDRWTR